jgi:amino acid adenylation domain-containing protein
MMLLERIEKRALRHPDRLAVLCGDRCLTYGGLARRSSQVARLLRRQASCGPDRLLGLCLDRSEWLLISILAILKTGSGYVPLDPAYPPERLHYILADSRVETLVTEARFAPLFAGFRQLLLEDLAGSLPGVDPSPLGRNPEPRHLAYVIYTSGTTGPPKGVMVEHRGLTNVILWAVQEFGNSPYDVVFAGSSESFDLSVFELLFPLVAGKTVRILSNLTIPLYLKRHQSVLLNTVPSLVRTIARRPDVLQGASVINLVGEELSPALYRDLQAVGGLEVRNIYGTTETTIHAINEKLGDMGDMGDIGDIPIGRPIANTEAYVLDRELCRVGPGERGEILLGGVGLARGYLGRPALTAERFVPNPYASGERLYRTGDLGSLADDGRLYYHGRIDDQIKIKGFRVEPGEISSYLDRHPKVKASVILARPDAQGGKIMVAFVRSEHDDLTEDDLRGFLRSKLPSYMVPGKFVVLREFPVAQTGKVDRHALLDLA